MNNQWIETESEVERPYCISLDADIPDGSRIIVRASGVSPDGNAWTKAFTNPHREPISLGSQNIDVAMLSAPASIAVPFLYALIIEGDRIKRTLPAEALIVKQNTSQGQIVLMPASNGRKFLTINTFPGTLVSASAVGRPWVASVSAWIPQTCRVQLTMLVQLKNNQFATITVEGIQPATLPFTDVIGFQHRIEMSGDGLSTPVISGLAIEGDGRRYFWPARALIPAQRPTIEEFFDRPHPDHKAQFSPINQRVFEPPTAVVRLTKMFSNGAFAINEE